MNNISCCGTICTECNGYPEQCRGCNELQGKVPWVNYVGLEVCSIYQCVVTDKKMSSCKACGAIPCGKWLATRDPSMSDEEFQQNIEDRMKKLGIDKKCNL